MKPLFCILFGCIFYSSGFAQDSTITLSQFEIFSSQHNRILKTEGRQLGSVGAGTVIFYKATDLTTGDSKKAVMLGWGRPLDEPVLIDPKNLYIDGEELDTVIEVLSRFVQIANTAKPAYNIQYSYITGDDILFTCLYDPFTETWRYSIGKVYKFLRTSVLNSRYTINRKRFTEWVDMLRNASTLK